MKNGIDSFEKIDENSFEAHLDHDVLVRIQEINDFWQWEIFIRETRMILGFCGTLVEAKIEAFKHIK